MSISEGPIAQPERGEISARISREIVQLHARLYGRGPTKARTFVEDDYVLSVLEEVFTTAERTLIRVGNGDQVVSTRAAFQDAVQDEFVSIVEQATGRKVRALLCQVHLSEGVAMELFLLHGEPSSDGGPPLGA